MNHCNRLHVVRQLFGHAKNIPEAGIGLGDAGHGVHMPGAEFGSFERQPPAFLTCPKLFLGLFCFSEVTGHGGVSADVSVRIPKPQEGPRDRDQLASLQVLEIRVHNQMITVFRSSNQAGDAGVLAFRKEVKNADACQLVGLQPGQRHPGAVDVHAALVKSGHANKVAAGFDQCGELQVLLFKLPAVCDVTEVHGQTVGCGVGGSLVPAICI